MSFSPSLQSTRKTMNSAVRYKLLAFALLLRGLRLSSSRVFSVTTSSTGAAVPHTCASEWSCVFNAQPERTARVCIPGTPARQDIGRYLDLCHLWHRQCQNPSKCNRLRFESTNSPRLAWKPSPAIYAVPQKAIKPFLKLSILPVL